MIGDDDVEQPAQNAVAVEPALGDVAAPLEAQRPGPSGCAGLLDDEFKVLLDVAGVSQVVDRGGVQDAAQRAPADLIGDGAQARVKRLLSSPSSAPAAARRSRVRRARGC